jgi:hypothetical protein
VEGFDTLKLNDAWTKYFWAYYCQLGTYLCHFQIFFSFLVQDGI